MQFKQTRLEIINRARPEDVPSEKALRDLLHNKIKESPGMKFELGLHYENLSYDDPKRSYKNLMNIIDRTIMRRREQSNLTQTQTGYAKCWKGRTFLLLQPTLHHLLLAGNPTKGNGNLMMQLLYSRRAKPKPMPRGKASPRRPLGASLRIPSPTKTSSIFGASFISPMLVVGMVTSVHSVIPRRLRRHQHVRERQVLPDEQETKCALQNCPFKHEAAPATPAAKAEAKAKAKAEAKAKSEPSAAAKKTAKSKAKPAAPAIRMCRAWNPSAPAIWKRSSCIADDESECSSIDSDVDSDCSTDDEVFGPASPTKSPKRRQVSFAKDVRFQPTKPRRSYKERDHGRSGQSRRGSND